MEKTANKIDKVCLIGNASGLHLRTWANILKRANIEYDIFSPLCPNIEYECNVKCPNSNKQLSPLYYFRLSRIARQYKYVNLHMPVFKGIFLFFMPKNSVYVNIWGSELLVLPNKYPIFGYFLKRVLKRAKLVIVPNEFTKDKVLEMDKDIKVKIIPFPVNDRKFVYDEKYKKGEFTILLPKEIKYVYGVDIMLKAWNRIYKKYGGKLIITGNNPLPKEWEDIIEDEIKKSIVFPGRVNNIEDLYKKAHITVIPSRSESFGIVALESLLMGVPVIASDIGGLSYIIRETHGGILVPSNDSDAIVRAVNEIMNSYDDWKNRAIKAKEIIIKKYGIKKAIEGVKSLWGKGF